MRRVRKHPKRAERGIAAALDAAGVSRSTCARWLGVHKSTLSHVLSDCEPHHEDWERRLDDEQVSEVLERLPEPAVAVFVQVAYLDEVGYRAFVDDEAGELDACLRAEADAMIDRAGAAHRLMRDGRIDEGERSDALKLADHLENHSRALRAAAKSQGGA